MASPTPTRRLRAPLTSADQLRQQRLTKARVALVTSHPFVATLALHMDIRLDDRFPTAATNGEWVAINPVFLDTLSDAQLLFCMAHEVFHPMLSHNYRLKGRDADTWNRAGDYVINQLLHDEQIGALIPDILFDPELYKAGGGTTDGIYALLTARQGQPGQGQPGQGQPGQGQPGQGQPGQGQPGQGQPGQGQPGQGQPGQDYTFQGDVLEAQDADGSKELETKARVAQAANAARMAGKLSAGLARLVDAVLKPKVPWQDVLHRFMVKVRTDQRSFARPNRRFAPQELYLPSITGEALGPVLVAVDCSGSITDAILAEFTPEIRAIHEDCRPAELHVVYFDSAVCHYDTFMPDDKLHIELHGGGGTAFSPIFRHALDHGVEPIACIVLTDLYCNDFGPQPDYPVLWVTNGSTKAPWGEVVEI